MDKYLEILASKDANHTDYNQDKGKHKAFLPINKLLTLNIEQGSVLGKRNFRNLMKEPESMQKKRQKQLLGSFLDSLKEIN
jgi:hypothetical protein